jgi:hypothetical protein
VIAEKYTHQPSCSLNRLTDRLASRSQCPDREAEQSRGFQPIFDVIANRVCSRLSHARFDIWDLRRTSSIPEQIYLVFVRRGSMLETRAAAAIPSDGSWPPAGRGRPLLLWR